MLIQAFKKEYYQWRYYCYVTKEMKKTKKSERTKLPYLGKPGVIFSFDDSFRVHDWYEYGKTLFGFYDVKVTFNINAYHHFEGKREHSQEEIDMLLELQSNGHEIAHHGFKHIRASKYSKETGIKNWVDEDIIPLFKWMREQSHSQKQLKFKQPVSYAFPHFNYDNKTLDELVPKFFKIARGHLSGDNLVLAGHTGLMPSICIDSKFFSNVKYIKKILRAAKKTGKNVVLTCHSILPSEVKWEDFGWEGEAAKKAGQWRTSPDTIKELIYEAKKQGFEFYTTSEIADVATFLDPNLEKAIRRHISNLDGQWISISEMYAIKDLDLSNSNIKNLDGIQYLLNVERISLKGNLVTDFRLLEKLPNLKEIIK
ncbi:polysaccharide deacetylase [Domibacillus sp. PGB-M46]|uniref:DUF2334 domain-containing protein n=1 Tax=Domibacillus sp. PGB-M46 TaxID=2910255 RepID=UPI001F5A11B7|nr:polysaccharide deacetylase family protein [Domibacillus sp. PGB-M46]MCI2255197.1 polysaccharide deacetylase [Domibacillus sp. PGB-M46]